MVVAAQTVGCAKKGARFKFSLLEMVVFEVVKLRVYGMYKRFDDLLFERFGIVLQKQFCYKRDDPERNKRQKNDRIERNDVVFEQHAKDKQGKKRYKSAAKEYAKANLRTLLFKRLQFGIERFVVKIGEFADALHLFEKLLDVDVLAL